MNLGSEHWLRCRTRLFKSPARKVKSCHPWAISSWDITSVLLSTCVGYVRRRYEQQTIDSNPDQQFSWHSTNIPEMMAFVALLIAMGINKSSRYRMYWSMSDILQIPFYRPSCPVIGLVQLFGSSTSPITKCLIQPQLNRTDLERFGLW